MADIQLLTNHLAPGGRDIETGQESTRCRVHDTEEGVLTTGP